MPGNDNDAAVLSPTRSRGRPRTGRPRRTPDEMIGVLNAINCCRAMGLNKREAIAYLRSEGFNLTDDRYRRLRKQSSERAIDLLRQPDAGGADAHAVMLAEVKMLRGKLWRDALMVRGAPKPDEPGADEIGTAERIRMDNDAAEIRTRIHGAIANIMPLTAALHEGADKRVAEIPLEAQEVTAANARQGRRHSKMIEVEEAPALPHPTAQEHADHDRGGSGANTGTTTRQRPPPPCIPDPDNPGLMITVGENENGQGV